MGVAILIEIRMTYYAYLNSRNNDSKHNLRIRAIYCVYFQSKFVGVFLFLGFISHPLVSVNNNVTFFIRLCKGQFPWELFIS